MTPKQRVAAFLAGQPIDRVVVVPLILNHAARVLGVKVSEYATDGETMGRAQVAAYRRYGHDLITIFTDTGFVAEAMGTKLRYPADDVARFEAPAMAGAGDIAKIKPADARESGRFPQFLKAIRRCVSDAGDDVFTSCCIPAPFTTAAMLRGTSVFARDLIRNRGLAEELLERATVATEDFCEAAAEAGGIPVLVDPVASGSVISRKAFQDFAMPGIARVLVKIKALGFPGILHICGRAISIVDLMADTRAAVLSIDQTPLAEARDRVGARVCLMGNVCPAGTLLEGTAEAVRAEAIKCLEDAGESPGGFILASGCEVPLETRPANIDALIAAARERSR